MVNFQEKNAAVFILFEYLMCAGCEVLWRSDESETTTDSETITSPFYPNPYPVNVFCRYTLVAQPHERVQLMFADFDLNYPQGNPNEPYRLLASAGNSND